MECYIPSIILSIQQEVHTDDGDTHRHDNENEEHEHHKAVNIVYFICPERCEDEIPETQSRQLLSSLKHRLVQHVIYISVI